MAQKDRCSEYSKTIDEFAAELLRSLQTDDGPTQISVTALSALMLRCDNNGQRVKACYQLMHDCQSFPPKPNNEKCDALSAKYREIGNGFFRHKHDYKAMHNYNLALTYAQSSKFLSLAFANRSAALYSLKKYKECLIDIERAFSSGYDEDLKPKLVKRKLFCEEKIAVDSSSSPDFVKERQMIFPFPEKTLKNVPCASSSVEITHTESMGRCVVAAEDISPGQVLVVEEPYMTMLVQKYYLVRCYSCCSLNDSMIPCEHCRYVMFCDETCRAESWNSAHKFECPLMPLLLSMKFTKIELLSLRTLLRARCDHSSWDELFHTIQRAESETDPKLRGFVKVPSSDGSSEDYMVYDSKHYTPIHMLESNVSARTVSDFFTRGITAAVFLRMLYKYTSFFDDCPIPCDMELRRAESLEADDYVWAAGGLLLHHNMTSASNMHNIVTIEEDKNHKFLTDASFGSGAYPFLSLLNHSCSPNAAREVFNTTVTLMALRPIKKGQQIFDNYGSHHSLHDYGTRQRELFFQYRFKCSCEACSNQWPTYFFLKKACFTNKKSKNKFRNLITPELILSLEMGDKAVAYAVINDLYKYAGMLEECAPCKELADYQETIKQCWSIFSNVVPYHD